MKRFTLGQRHGSTSWEIILGPDSTREVHREFWNRRRFATKDRAFREIVKINGGHTKQFERQTGQDIESSSSSASSASTASSQSSSSSSSVNSSSSSSSSVNSSSSSSSTESSSSSSTASSSSSS